MSVNPSTPQYTDEGLRVLLAEDYFIYVVRESDGLIFSYITEMWQEWLDLGMNEKGEDNGPVSKLIPFAHRYTPRPLAKTCFSFCYSHSTEEQMTLADWEAEHSAQKAASSQEPGATS
jgi:hypothetical protein